MTEKDIIKYIESPALLKQADMSELRKLVSQYPFYPTAHILLLKSLKDKGVEDFEKQLYQSSVYISDRELLLQFLNTDFAYNEPEVQVTKEEIQEEATIQEDTSTIKILKNKDVRRKINDTFEGMGKISRKLYPASLK